MNTIAVYGRCTGNIVLMAQFPSKEVAQLSYEYRTLGLGYATSAPC
jgi:ribonucleotide reductase alpha subunit